MPAYGTNGYGAFGLPNTYPVYPAPYQGNQMGYAPFQPMNTQQQNVQQPSLNLRFFRSLVGW